MNFVEIGNVGDGEFKPTAAHIFLSSVHRSTDSTGDRPNNNIVSSALMHRIIAESGFQMVIPVVKAGWTTPNSLFGYPVKVVESDKLFAVSID